MENFNQNNKINLKRNKKIYSKDSQYKIQFILENNYL